MTTPVIIKREKIIDIPPAILWELVEPAERISDWLLFAEKSELISGKGKGRLQKMFSRWGNKEVQIVQEVVAYEPMRLIKWKHINELSDGKKIQTISKETYFTIKLLPYENGTSITLQSENYPGNFLKRLLILLIAKPRIDAVMKKSLILLSGKPEIDRPS
jgi:hypothetical protein